MTQKKRIGWKKVTYSKRGEHVSAILKLEIRGPVSTRRKSTQYNYRRSIYEWAYERKRRTNEVKVLAAFDMRGNRLPKGTVFHSIHDWDFLYRVGKVRKLARSEASEFDVNGPTCSTGIHFFFAREEAEAY